jgi:MipA family protein
MMFDATNGILNTLFGSKIEKNMQFDSFNIALKSGLLIASVLAISGVNAFAQDPASDNGPYASITLGGAYGSDYSGSDDYEFSPFPSAEIGYNGFKLSTNGLGLQADLIPSPIFDAGPIVRMGASRNNKVKDAKVKLLPEVKSKLEVGGYVGAGLPLNILGLDTDAILAANLEYIQGLNGGHEGSTFGGSLSLVKPINEQLSFVTSVSTTYIDDDYAKAFYGISAAGSAASGLNAYTAKAGFSDVGISLAANYQWSDAWSLGATAGYTRIIGDAAKSPVVKDRGSVDQLFAGVGITYTFK